MAREGGEKWVRGAMAALPVSLHVQVMRNPSNIYVQVLATPGECWGGAAEQVQPVRGTWEGLGLGREGITQQNQHILGRMDSGRKGKESAGKSLQTPVSLCKHLENGTSFAGVRCLCWMVYVTPVLTPELWKQHLKVSITHPVEPHPG